jgi:hypothetical protein
MTAISYVTVIRLAISAKHARTAPSLFLSSFVLIKIHNGVHCLSDGAGFRPDRFHVLGSAQEAKISQGREEKSRDSETVNSGSGNHIAFGETRCVTAIQGTRINMRFDLSSA